MQVSMRALWTLSRSLAGGSGVPSSGIWAVGRGLSHYVVSPLQSAVTRSDVT